jgi:hypothetical protein
MDAMWWQIGINKRRSRIRLRRTAEEDGKERTIIKRRLFLQWDKEGHHGQRLDHRVEVTMVMIQRHTVLLTLYNRASQRAELDVSREQRTAGERY